MSAFRHPVPTDMLDLGTRVKHRMEELGYTIPELEVRLGTKNTVKSIVTGKTSDPTASTIVRLARVLRTTPNFLLLGQE